MERNLLVLYIGEQGDALQSALQPHGWDVVIPDDMFEALGAYVVLVPDVIVFDGMSDAPYIEEAFYHLCDVDARPLIVLVGDAIPAWSRGLDYVIPAEVETEELMTVIRQAWLAEQQPHVRPAVVAVS